MVSDLDFGCVQVLHIASVSQVLAVEKGGVDHVTIALGNQEI
jgi:hypothetical protein